MKKLFIALVAIIATISMTSCKYKVSEEKTLSVFNGQQEKVDIENPYLYQYEFDGKFKNKELAEAFLYLPFANLEQTCNYPATFVPKSIILTIDDTIQYNGKDLYVIGYIASGYAKNGFGVEGEVSNFGTIFANISDDGNLSTLTVEKYNVDFSVMNDDTNWEHKGDFTYKNEKYGVYDFKI